MGNNTADDVVGKIDRPSFIGANTTIGMFISNIYQTILIFAGLVLLIMLSVAGIKWMTAGGDTKVKESAIDTMKNAIIGIVVVVLAWSLTVIFGRFLGIGPNILQDIVIDGPTK